MLNETKKSNLTRDNAGEKMISCFARSPNSLGYCGNKSAGDTFTDCLSKGCCDKVMDEVKNFIVLKPYLRTLAKALKMPESNIEVVEAYWLGNEQLKKIKLKDYHFLLDMFREQGVPEWLVSELSQKPPKIFIPTHLFQVLHVGVGRASGSVPYNIETINNCMVRWGKVAQINNGVVKVKLNSLKDTKESYLLSKIEEAIPYNNLLVENISIGDIVAVHWNQVVRKLTPNEVKKITYWTKEVLRSFRKSDR